MAPNSSIFLSNGTVLLHDRLDNINPVKADVLIIDNKIAKIAPSISPPSDATHLDCTGKLLAPGFVDTHHHLWQTQLKGRHADDIFIDYMVKGPFELSKKTYQAKFSSGSSVYSFFSPEDMFWGQMGGCLEAVDSGTTTVVDHAHMNYSAEHSSSALSATVASGIRSYFCYVPVPHAPATSLAPFEYGTNKAEWAASQLEDLAARQPFGDGRVRLGVAFDAFYLPKEFVVSLYERARGMGIKLFTTHYVQHALFGPRSFVKILHSCGLLKDDILLSHANNALPEDAELIVANGAHISSTPGTELQVGLGYPVSFRPDLHDVASLGIDCHSSSSGDMLAQMRIAVQNARGLFNQPFVEAGKAPRSLDITALQAFNLATIKGARAIGMGDEIGSIAEGKLADIVIYDAESPSMICGAEHDPVAAIVMHASVRDVDTVIVDGKIRKQGGKLVAVEMESTMAAEGKMEWRQIAAKLSQSRSRLEETLKTVDMESARKAAAQVMYVDEQNIVDHQ
ncbi:Metallo-dependent hydrolase [Favolaschia claudopus]|uniref:Metallo-dependent hydrolase n=1 Tax=Favolaschia claudopus TaxID=2862362 RepID=A0AAW0CFJ2_9AGAR